MLAVKTLFRFKRAMRLSARSLWLHRLRSFLTMLGLVFGVCSVIAMLAIGEGASYEAQEQIKNLGSQNIIVRSRKPPEDQKASDRGSQDSVLRYGITFIDAKCIRATIPGITLELPARIVSDYVWHIHRRFASEIVGTTHWYPVMRNRRLVSGRFFTEAEMDRKEPVGVLGAELAQTLFPLGSAIGQEVRIRGNYYRIVGIIEPIGKTRDNDLNGVFPAATQGEMFIPLTTARVHYGDMMVKNRTGSMEMERVELHEITIKVHSLEEVVGVSEAIKQVLEHTHQKRDYEIIVPLDLLRRAERTKQIFNVVLGSIAAISLVVGGIGIMNIMLATVTERTREIGIRRALGARRKDIVIQFLIETVMLSGTGGSIGVLLGLIVPQLVTYFAGMKTMVTFWGPTLAFTISAFVGIVFGIYPALHAARMDPVEALRHE